MATSRHELKELSDAIDVLARLQGEEYLKASPRVESELSEIELKFHRKVRELRNKHKPVRKGKVGVA
jgi:hypothetical protein